MEPRLKPVAVNNGPALPRSPWFCGRPDRNRR